jgi:hypothetical protein
LKIWKTERSSASSRHPFAVGANPVAQVAGDFNGDGHADLVVVNQNANTISVLLGNGDDTFRPKIDYATGTTPIRVVVGDFNGDGKVDIATANFGAKSVSVLLGNGDGTFRPRTDIALSTTPVSLAVGDLNGDGKLDLAVATEDLASDDVTVLNGNGNGDGTFQAPVSTVSDTPGKGIALILEPFSTISTGDFNGDGRPDVVVVSSHDFWNQRSGQFFVGGTVSVLLGNGDGTLQAPRVFAVGTSPRTVATGDFNGDGRLDFAVGHYLSGTVSVFMNTGGGSFTSSNLVPGGAPASLAAGDFNGDLSSADSKAGTQNFTFSNNDNGVHVFSYTFPTLGFPTLTIVDTTNNSIGASVIIDVLPKS